MTEAIEIAIYVAAGATVVTALGVIWLCFKTVRVSDTLASSDFASSQERAEAQQVILETLARIEEASTALLLASARLSESVNRGNRIGNQNAEASARMESAAGVVAQDLADSIHRADITPKGSDYGAAADNALRSAEVESGEAQ